MAAPVQVRKPWPWSCFWLREGMTEESLREVGIHAGRALQRPGPGSELGLEIPAPRAGAQREGGNGARIGSLPPEAGGVAGVSLGTLRGPEISWAPGSCRAGLCALRGCRGSWTRGTITGQRGAGGACSGQSLCPVLCAQPSPPRRQAGRVPSCGATDSGLCARRKGLPGGKRKDKEMETFIGRLASAHHFTEPSSLPRHPSQLRRTVCWPLSQV